ncbi:MAG TPA: 2-phospho-L-lactate transferase [Candidatus Binatia bacterium]|nr:2-phospho-L-lactate transferase [Candidatus Binatia bacterium]
MLVALTGGTGGAKLIEGLSAEIDPAELTVICNTADDCEFHGLYVSPDIDTIIYTMAGMIDEEKGWGVQGDSFVVLEQLRRLGSEVWFKLGDKDLATHITRTQMLRAGHRLSEVTSRFCRTLGIGATVLPMSDDRIETRIATPRGEISFQEFFVKQHWQPEVAGVRFVGAESSRPAPGVVDAIERAAAIVICPSNPVTSIGPMLAVPGIRAALKKARAPIAAVSPLIGATAISGPAHKLMRALGRTPTALGVAEGYSDFLDTLVIAKEDQTMARAIEDLRIRAVWTDIRMASREQKRRLAREVLALVGK